jgi:hypothetical protein
MAAACEIRFASFGSRSGTSVDYAIGLTLFAFAVLLSIMATRPRAAAD